MAASPLLLGSLGTWCGHISGLLTLRIVQAVIFAAFIGFWSYLLLRCYGAEAAGCSACNGAQLACATILRAPTS